MQIDVAQQFCAAQQHGSWIGYIFANGFRECVTRTLKKNNQNQIRFDEIWFGYSLGSNVVYRFEDTMFG